MYIIYKIAQIVLTEKYVLIKAIIKFQNIMFQVYFLTGGVYEKWLHFKMLTWKIAKKTTKQFATCNNNTLLWKHHCDGQWYWIWSSVVFCDVTALNRKCIKCLCPEENKLSLGVLLRWLIKLEREESNRDIEMLLSLRAGITILLCQILFCSPDPDYRLYVD